jgi:hypothetical protein
MDNKSELLAKQIKEKILENFFEYIRLFTPVQSSFLSSLHQRYQCLESANIVLYFEKKTHQAILRQKNFDLNYDLSFKKFWQNHNVVEAPQSTIIDIAKNTNLPKETTRRKILELTKQKILVKKNRFTLWAPSEEYKKTYNDCAELEIKQLTKLTKYITDKINLNISSESILNKYKEKFSFYWFNYLNLQLRWMQLWKSQLHDLEIVLIFMQIASLLSSRVKEKISHNILFSEPNIINNPITQNLNVSVSATSLSDITGIPRATCIRKLNFMVAKKLLMQDGNSKRYYIIPEALTKNLVSKDLTEKVTGLFSEFYFISIKAMDSKISNQ